MELIEEQQGAFAAALASGWSAGELAELGMARRRRLYHLSNKHNTTGSAGPVNGAKNADGGPYEISTMG